MKSSAFEQARQFHLAGAGADAFAAYLALLPEAQTEPDFWHWLGLLAYQSGEVDRAFTYLQRGLALDQTQLLGLEPAEFHALPLSFQKDCLYLYQALGHLYLRENQHEMALQIYALVLPLLGSEADSLHFHLARIYQSVGELDLAYTELEQALSLAPEQPFYDLQRDLLYAPFWRSGQDLAQEKHDLLRVLAAWRRQIDLLQWAGNLSRLNLDTLFDLHYHFEDPLPIQRAFAEVFLPPPPPATHDKRNNPVKLGFVVTPRHEGMFIHAVGGIIQQLQHPALQALVFGAPESLPLLKAFFANHSALEVLPLPLAFPAMISYLQSHHLDLMYYWESGTDAINYFLPFFRPARIQITSWGSAGSTGIPQMDYFLSSPTLEPPNAQTHYSEKLVLLDYLPTYFADVTQRPIANQTRADYGMAEQKTIYLCPGNLLKIQPDFEGLLAELAYQDSCAQIVLLATRFEVWNQTIVSRIQAGFARPEQLLVLPRLAEPDFFRVLLLADVVLDTWYYGAGKVAYEVFNLGQGMVTWPGQRLKGRIVSACYQQMGLKHWISPTQTAYLEMALALGRDSQLRAKLRAEVKTASSRLLARPEMVRAFENCLLDLARRPDIV